MSAQAVDGLAHFWRLLLFILFSIEAFCGDSKAPLYTENDFIAQIPDSPHFVMFFAPWCSHCERLTPLWDKLASHLVKRSSPVTAAKVDCATDTQLCAQEDIKAYPTLRFFNNGNKETYRGSRDVSEFVHFTTNQLAKTEKNPVSEGELEMELGPYKFEKEIQAGLKIVNFFAPWCSHCQRLAPVWRQLAEEYQYASNVRILKMDCEKQNILCKKYSINGFPKIVAFFDGVWKNTYEGSRSFENLKEFVENNVKEYASELEVTEEGDKLEPIEVGSDDPQELDFAEDNYEVINLGRDIFDMTVENGKTFVYFFAPWCRYCKEFSPVWDEFAKKVLEQGIMTKIAKVDCIKEETLCRELQIPGFPSLILFKSRLNFQKYEGNRDVDSLLQFVRKYEHDEL